MPPREFTTPRSFAVFPDQFGLEQDFAGWMQVKTLNDFVGLRAAEVQHAWVAQARGPIEATGLLQPAFEKHVGLGSKRLSKLLNSHTALSLDDALRIETQIGPILVGLTVEWWTVQDDDLAARFPNARGLQAWNWQ